MRNRALVVLLLSVFLLAAACVSAPAEAADGETDEWTVLCYFCGSDLESKYSYASGNLEEIHDLRYPDNYRSAFSEGESVPEDGRRPGLGKVNILIETGGAKEWHAEEAGLKIDKDALQRWSYNCNPYGGEGEDRPHDGFELMETLPLQNMADPRTLADFIRWGTETRPAKKYALLLWDHGGGAKSGLIIDELFGNDIMYLYELRQAMAEGGVLFETVVIDACMMANVETAWSLKDYARWLTASEEIVPGKGTAIGSWLQQLIDHPEGDGKWLGRVICDETLSKYANEADGQAQSILTWSVIDLSRIDPLLQACGRFFRRMNDDLRNDPWVANLNARHINDAEEFGDGRENMRDLTDVAYDHRFIYTVELSVRDEILNTLSEAIVYSVRGHGRSGARGLSFCYPTDFSPEELDIYALNFPMPEYLAYLDAVSEWEAPDWVYEQTEHVPDIDTMEEFMIKATKRMSETGMPGLDVDESLANIDGVYYRLYRKDPATGEVIRLGRTDCAYELCGEHYSPLFHAYDPTHWPSVDGELFCMDLIQTRLNQKLYNVPVQVSSQNGILRCGRIVTDSADGGQRRNEYIIYGLWEGFEEHSEQYNRSVKTLAELMGQEYRFLYPVDGKGFDDGNSYLIGPKLSMYRALSVKEIPLPEGTYYLEYELDDLFKRPYVLERIEFYWDGKNITFPEGFSWEGEILFDIA